MLRLSFRVCDARRPPAVLHRSILAPFPVFERAKLAFDLGDLLVAAVLQIDKPVACRFQASQQLIKLEVQGTRIAALRVLDQEHHEEGNDGRARINHQLPGIRVAEEWPRDRPGEHQHARGDKRC